MRILVTGANGYIGTRLIERLVQDGHFVYALVRNPIRFDFPGNTNEHIMVVTGDLLKKETLKNLPVDYEAAYFLIHSMSHDSENFDIKDRLVANNFLDLIKNTKCHQVIYLSGIVNDEGHLSKHLNSRYEVEKILKTGPIPVTCLRAAIIMGSGSASFEIIRDLVEKLPIMVAPKWLKSKCQPIAIRDVIDYLAKVLNNPPCYNKSFDIGGPEKLTYKEMLLRFAKLRHLKRYIVVVPVLTPKLSSKWLFLMTSVSYELARSLVESLKNDAVCKDTEIQKIIPKKCLTYEESIQKAFKKIEDNDVVSSWKDSWSASELEEKYKDYVKVPTYGCLIYEHSKAFSKDIDPKIMMEAVYRLGGKNGYYINWAWKIRGFIDRALGGVGLGRGKTSRKKPRPGDAIDFWRVLLVDDNKKRFLLYAEMKLPGEAWLEFNIREKSNANELSIKATFRPRGVLGRIYWHALWPIHEIIFRGLLKRILNDVL